MTMAQHLSDDVLNAWLDHVLPADEHDAIETHLRQCDACRREADSLAAIIAALAALPQADPPRSFRLTPEQARRPEPAAAPPVHGVLRLLPVVRSLSIAAVMALLIVSGAMLLGPVGSDDGSMATMGVAGETSGRNSASLEQEAEEAGGGPGSIVDRGEAASAGTDALSNAAAPRSAMPQPEPEPATSEPVATDEDDVLSPLAITAIGLGVASVALLGLWFALSRMGAASPAR